MSTSTHTQHLAFYTFAQVDDVEGCVESIRTLCTETLPTEADPVFGNILVATEGLNGQLSGTAEQLDQFEAFITSKDCNNGAFSDWVVKRTNCIRQPFTRFRVRGKAEIVPLRIDGFDPVERLDDIHKADVPPSQWRDLITRDDVVLIDNRNHFEYQVGSFVGAIDPGVRDFADFTGYVEANAEQWKAEGKTVAMYCTGGIRCEKSSAWMQDLGLEVKQLQGGILNYFQEMSDSENIWTGECFVFDDRVTLDTNLAETGKTLADIPGQFGRMKPTKSAE